MLLGEDNATVEHDLEAVRPEKVVDFEVGVEHRAPRLALQASLYDMRFEDEIASAAEVSTFQAKRRSMVSSVLTSGRDKKC